MAREVSRRRRVIEEMARQCPNEQRCGRVLQIHPLQVSLAMKHRWPADRPERCASVMANDGLRDVTAAVAAQPRSIRQVHILVGHEEVVVESPKFVEDRLRHQAGAAAHPEHLRRDASQLHRFPVVPLERTAPPEQPVTGAVDDTRVVHVHDARCSQRKTRRQLDSSAQRTKPARIRNCVVVEKRDELAARLTRAGVVAAGEAEILGERDHPDTRKTGADELGSAIG